MASIGGSRTLKLTILGDVDNLKKSLNSGSDDVEGFADKLGSFGKKAAAAFAVAAAAAAAYAVHLAVDGVKAALEDEAAQVKLANALKNATGATEDQIKATETAILKLSLATGVADNNLRPAMSRLALSTNDVGKAQELLALSLDVATQTGKPLEAVANALGKAYDGNTAALGKLGIGLSAAELKAMSFTEIQTKLTNLMGGAALANAATYQGGIDKLKVAFDEAKETLGFALLPQLGKLTDFLTTVAVPALQALIAGFTGDKSLKSGMTTVQLNAFTLGEQIKELGKTFSGFFKAFSSDSTSSFSGFINVIKGVVTAINGVLKALEVLANVAITVINAVIAGYNLIPGVKDIPFVQNFGAVQTDPNTGLPVKRTTASTTSTAPGLFGTGASSVSGFTPPIVVVPVVPMPTISTAGTSTSAGVSSAAKSAAVAVAASAAASSPLAMTGERNAATSPIINLTVNGAIDSEGTARTVVDTLNNSYFRGTGGGGALFL